MQHNFEDIIDGETLKISYPYSCKKAFIFQAVVSLMHLFNLDISDTSAGFHHLEVSSLNA